MAKPPPTEPKDSEIAEETGHRRSERRRFMKDAGIVAGLSAASAYAALAPKDALFGLGDLSGEAGKPTATAFELPKGGYAIDPGPAPTLGIARGQDVGALVKGAIAGIGGIERYIAKGDIVVIKPNVAFERAAPLGATTNPEILTALIEMVRAAGAAEIRVADNPIESPESCFERSGIRAASVSAGARVYLPSPGDFDLLHTPGATWIERWPFFWRPFMGANKVIGVAPVKDHNLCRASMTTKNWYGLLGGRRNQFHQDIHGIISDLALMLRPTFVVLDGTRVLFRSGPTGGSLSDVRAGNTVVASRDSLAADAFGWEDLLRRGDEALPPYFSQAAARGLGNPNWRDVPFKEVQLG